MVSWSPINIPGYDYLTLSGAELEEVNGLRILGITLDSKMTFMTHLREIAWNASGSLGVVRQVGKLFAYPRVLNSCFNAYVLFTLEYYTSVWMSSPGSHLGLQDSVVRSTERLSEGELCCLGHIKN